MSEKLLPAPVPPDAVEQAEAHVDDVLTSQLAEGLDKIERERHGEGCGCNTCKRQAVRFVNATIALAIGRELEEHEQYKIKVEHKGISIVAPDGEA